MKTLRIIPWFFLYLSATSFELPDFFNYKYQEAIDIYKSSKALLRDQCNSNEKYQVCSSIVFPEFLRYSEFKDFFEKGVLKKSYVLFGSEAADFSIGYCQMKPSFIEKLEDYVKNSDPIFLEFPDIVEYHSTTKKDIRVERLERLESIEWQYRYLSCFYEIMQELTREFVWIDTEDKIRYYSTAYNYNFLASKAKIISMFSKQWFPYGPNYKNNQMPYHEAAIKFHRLNFKN